MKKSVKICVIVFVIVFLVIIDTIQARILDNRPIIKIVQDYNGSDVLKRDNGIFVYTYNFNNGDRVTVFKWEKYAPPEKSINTVESKNLDSEENEKMEDNISINVSINDKKYIAKIENNETAKSFITQLPQEFNMQELNGNEKYVYMNKSLPTNSEIPEHIECGDIMLYENNCLVIFYKSFDTNYRYTKIGHIENLPQLDSDSIVAKFE